LALNVLFRICHTKEDIGMRVVSSAGVVKGRWPISSRLLRWKVCPEMRYLLQHIQTWLAFPATNILLI